MNLIFIYGPPAAGKLTVAKDLAQLTGYTLFHNHLTRDLVQELYPGDFSQKYDLVASLRLEVFKFFTQHNTNAIFTYVYVGENDDVFVNNVVEVIRKNKGTIHFVELRPTDDVLLDRVERESRKAFRKLVDKEILKSDLAGAIFKTVPFDDVLRIDNSAVEPDAVAAMIADYFKLK